MTEAPHDTATPRRRALVTGVRGQDGAYLAAHLLAQGYDVIGGSRGEADGDPWRLAELGIDGAIQSVPFDLGDYAGIERVVAEVRPHEIYNLAAQSSVAASLKEPLSTCDIDGLGVVRLLDAVRVVDPKIRVFQASSADMFGEAKSPLQNEASPFFPKSPYAVAKLFAHQAVGSYRESFGLYAASAILFNHESPMRGEFFVTRKITTNFAVRKAQPEKAAVLELGNMSTKRDWGFAGDYVVAMHAMLQRDTARDYVLATGQASSVRDFVGFAAEAAGITLVWAGEGAETTATDAATGDVIVRVNPVFFRPNEVDGLTGDASRAREELGFAPKGTLRDLARLMVEADVRRLGAR